MNHQSKESKKLFVSIIVVCVTVLLLAGIGGWVYIQDKELKQQERALQQQKELTEYEQEQINKREQDRQTNERIDGNDNCSNWFSGC